MIGLTTGMKNGSRFGWGRRSRWLLVLLVTALLPLTAITATPAAHADPPVFDGQEIKDLCTLSAGGQDCPVFPPPPPLLNPGAVASAGPEVAASLQRLQDRAVINAIESHQLPLSDRDAVLSWGRADAQAELWALIQEALETPAGQRTTVQQHAVDWMTQMTSAQTADAGYQAGAEYATWAGLDLLEYKSIAHTATTAELTAFLSEDVRTYNYLDLERGGYCRYTPPAPYDSEDYDGSTSPNCFSACTSIMGCPIPTPDYDDFVDWGQAVSEGAFDVSDPAFAVQARAVASGVAFGATVAVAALAATGLATTVGTALLASSVGAVIFNQLVYIGAAAAGGFAGAAVIGAVAIVIFAIVAAVLEGIRVFENAALPGQIAQLVVTARTTVTDASTLIGTTEGATQLFYYFVAATMPVPKHDLGCDNALIPPWAYTASFDPNLLIYVPLGHNKTITSPTDRRGCLNPPPIPPVSAADAKFRVTPHGQAADSQMLQSIDMRDPSTGTAMTVRLHNSWFIQKSGGSNAVQSLRLVFENWDGETQLAWLLRDTRHGGWFFLGIKGDDSASELNPESCDTDGVCWESKTLQYIGADGRKYSATAEPPPAASVQEPMYSPAAPLEGEEVTLSANGFAPARPVGDVTHTWRIQRTGCGNIACVVVDSGVLSPSYDGPFTGESVSYTWQALGNAKVELTATDSHGRSAQTTFVVPVGNVPPTARGPQEYDATAGTPIKIQSVVGDAGLRSNHNVEISFGDRVVKSTKVGDASVPFYDPDINRLPFPSEGGFAWSILADHAYAEPGTYYGSVTVSDWGGGTDRTTFTVRVTGKQTVSFPRVADQTYGDVVEMQGVGSASSSPVVYTSQTPGVCEPTGLTGRQVRLVGVGECTIVADQAPDLPLFRAADSKTQTFDVEPAPLVIMVDDKVKTYGAADPRFTATYDGFVAGEDEDDLSGLQLVRVRGEAVGDYRINAAGASNPHYDIDTVPGGLQITRAPLTITADDATKRYGAPNPAFTADLDGLVNGDTADDVTGLTFDGPRAGVGVGVYDVTPKGARSPNYEIDYVDGTLEVTPADLTITADDKTQVYGAAEPAYTATFEGFVNGDTTSDVAGLTFSGPPSGSDVGAYDITPSGAAADNYDIDFVAGTQRVTPAPLTITADDKTTRYGGPDPELTATFDGLVNGDVRADVDGLVLTGPPSGADAGEHPITPSGATAGNYDIAFLPGTQTILRAPLTIRPADVVVASGTPARYPWIGDGWVHDDEDRDLLRTGRTSPTCTAKVGGVEVTASTAPGAYARAITCSGARHPNYDIAYALADLRIDPVISLAQVGLPATVERVVRLDGTTEPLPVTPRQVVLGSAHSYSFPAVVIGPAGRSYVTTAPSFAGVVTSNVEGSAHYLTMHQILARAVLQRGLTQRKADTVAKSWSEVRNALEQGTRRQVRRAVRAFAGDVRAGTRPGHLTEATAQDLLDHAQAVYAYAGGGGGI